MLEKWFKCVGEVLVFWVKLDCAREEVCSLSSFVIGWVVL